MRNLKLRFEKGNSFASDGTVDGNVRSIGDKHDSRVLGQTWPELADALSHNLHDN
jgi:hypothetical protein